MFYSYLWSFLINNCFLVVLIMGRYNVFVLVICGLSNFNSVDYGLYLYKIFVLFLVWWLLFGIVLLVVWFLFVVIMMLCFYLSYVIVI